MFAGLPGGSPGPDAEGTWYGLLMIFLLSAAIGGGFLYFCHELSKLDFYGI
ncbi:MAG: hypothetical protein H6819_13100 [Phycisphaerales bacterium]|nr:hypothetical protein [Phycisphaerales bacterium]MCB9855772.1 hypothetical protein [Phycisphaerales bacterium]MCB9862667.1 hypothetical protein [Phycisphaerales bacterium]